MANRTTRATTPEAEAAYAKYQAEMLSDHAAKAGRTMAERIIAQIGETLARERFPHYFA